VKVGEIQKVPGQLEEYVEEFSSYLGRSERRHWCLKYLSGLRPPKVTANPIPVAFPSLLVVK